MSFLLVNSLGLSRCVSFVGKSIYNMNDNSYYWNHHHGQLLGFFRKKAPAQLGVALVFHNFFKYLFDSFNHVLVWRCRV